jgi:hypothetical protein
MAIRVFLLIGVALLSVLTTMGLLFLGLTMIMSKISMMGWSLSTKGVYQNPSHSLIH